MNTDKTNSRLECGQPRRAYTKAKMNIIEIDSVDIFTASGAATRQIDGFGKQGTNDWFESEN